MSILKTIYDTLKKDGIKVYMPGTHKGECLEPYAVVKLDGATPDLIVSSERPVYTILLYVPINQYTKLEDFEIEVKNSMKKVFPLVMYVGNETPSYYEEDKKAHMVSFQYLGCRKVNNF